MRFILSTAATLVLACFVCSGERAQGQLSADGPNERSSASPHLQSAEVVEKDSATEQQQTATAAEVERLRAEVRRLAHRVADLENTAADGTATDPYVVPELDDLIERHRIPLKDVSENPLARRLMIEKWYLYGAIFCEYDPKPLPGEPVSYEPPYDAKQASEHAQGELGKVRAWVFSAIARNPDLIVHRACFDANFRGGDRELRRLQELQNVVLVCFYYSVISDDAVKQLQPLKTLTDLDFRHTGITDEALTTLADIKSLRRLTLAEENVTLSGVHALLAHLPKIKQVRLDGTCIGLDDRQEQSLREAFPGVKFIIRRS